MGRPLALVLLCWLTLPGISSMLNCDSVFVGRLNTAVSEVLFANVSHREALIERISKMFLDTYQRFFSRSFLRILDVRAIDDMKQELLQNLLYARYSPHTWKGVNVCLLDMYTIQNELKSRMRKSLEAFADLACANDCTLIEGEVLDAHTCDITTAQCLKGKSCGEMEPREREEIFLYLFLVAEFVMLSCIVILWYVCLNHKRKTKSILGKRKQLSKMHVQQKKSRIITKKETEGLSLLDEGPQVPDQS